MSANEFLRPLSVVINHDSFAEFTKLKVSHKQIQANYSNGVTSGRWPSQELVEMLPALLSSPPILYAAWVDASARSQTAGPNGNRWRDFSDAEAWAHCRYMSDCLRAGEYVHGPVRYVRIKKAGGRGYRRIAVPNIQDRVVARAAHQIISPWFAREILPLACCAQRRGVAYALAAGEMFTNRRRCFHWIRQDLKTAFERVPRQRLLEIVRSLVPSPPVVDLVSRLLEPAGARGIPQGSPVSSLLFEIYRNRCIDRPWNSKSSRRNQQLPLIAYADDLVVIAPSEEIPQAEQELRSLSRSAGFDLKYSPEEAVIDVRERELDWLGYRLRWRNNRMECRWSLLDPRNDVERHDSERRLRERFLQLYDRPNCWMRASSTFESLLRQAGPCYEFMDRRSAYELALGAAASAGFEELPSFARAERIWKRAHGQWRDTRKLVRSVFPSQQSFFREHPTPRTPCRASADNAPLTGGAPWE